MIILGRPADEERFTLPDVVTYARGVLPAELPPSAAREAGPWAEVSVTYERREWRS